jgi:hypothetical protein
MTQEMKPTYVTFEQAKWLKEKGLNDHFYHRQGEDSTRWVSCKYCYDPLDESKTLQLWSDNIESSTKERLERLISAPEQHQVVEWLRVNHGIWVSVGVGNLFHGDKFFILIKKYNIDRWELTPLDNERHSPYDTPQQAYSAAFDYILNNLI